MLPAGHKLQVLLVPHPSEQAGNGPEEGWPDPARNAVLDLVIGHAEDDSSTWMAS